MSLAAELEFASDPNDIFYNKQVRVLSDGSPVATGRCLPVDYGTATGQGFVKRNVERQSKPIARTIPGGQLYVTDLYQTSLRRINVSPINVY